MLQVPPPERFSLGHCSFCAAQSGAVVLPRSALARRLRIVRNELETRLQVFMMFTSRSPRESTDVGVDNISNVAGVWVKGQLRHWHVQLVLYLQDLLKPLWYMTSLLLGGGMLLCQPRFHWLHESDDTQVLMRSSRWVMLAYDSWPVVSCSVSPDSPWQARRFPQREWLSTEGGIVLLQNVESLSCDSHGGGVHQRLSTWFLCTPILKPQWAFWVPVVE